MFKFISKIFDRGRTIADLAKWLALPEEQLRDWLEGHPPDPRGRDYYFNQFSIPKRRGGERTIHAPSEGLKTLQRRILHRMLNPLPVHPAATGFTPGRSIVDNARPHAGLSVVINIDLANFFPSITAERSRITRDAFRGIGWGKDAASILARICTYEGRLPQGAPTSPAISNLVCRRLDERFTSLVKGHRSKEVVFRNPQTGEPGTTRIPSKEFGGHYTRYADDLTFSFPGFGKNKLRRPRPKDRPRIPRPPKPPGRELLTKIRTIIEEEGFQIQMRKKPRHAVRVQNHRGPPPIDRQHYRRPTGFANHLEEEGFQIQMRKKVRVQRPHQRQTATGLVVNRVVNLPRAVRRRIRAMRHHEKLATLDAAARKRLRGLESLQPMIEKQRQNHP